MTNVPSSEKPSSTDQPLTQSPRHRIGKKIYAIAAIILVAVVVTAVFFVPRGAADSIPLSLNYEVGEEMVYETTETGQSGQLNSTSSLNSTSTLKVVSFDGEHYTLNRTVTTMLNRPISVSITERINKTGYATYFLPGNTQNLFGNKSSNPVLAALLSKPDAKVGDTWQIPLDTGNSTRGTMGSLTLTFAGIQDVTVPAGAYRVFRIDVSSNNLASHVDIPEGKSDTTMNFTGSIFLEYGSCRQIKSDVQMSIAIKSTVLNSTMTLSSQMILVQHNRT